MPTLLPWCFSMFLTFCLSFSVPLSLSLSVFLFFSLHYSFKNVQRANFISVCQPLSLSLSFSRTPRLSLPDTHQHAHPHAHMRTPTRTRTHILTFLLRRRDSLNYTLFNPRRQCDQMIWSQSHQKFLTFCQITK